MSNDEFYVVNVTDEDFHIEVYQSNIPVLLEFWAPWCRPCLSVAPILESIANEYQGRLKVCKVNIEKAPKTTQSCQIMSVPAFYMLKSDDFKFIMNGVIPNFESVMRSRIDDFLFDI